ncbi:hypothetical protein K438DRAFT_1964009 [Mycena galopus ATCC 62051]|nr:hypothetical protein K438DRAFT_1964009 [Mycena galopus ATCC 62051]
MEAYLERSGQHPLTFRLSYDMFDQLQYQPFLQRLGRDSARWSQVVLESPNASALEYLAQTRPSDYPSLRSLACSHCELPSSERTLAPFPWSQVQRYHESEVSWCPDSKRQWSIVTQLTNVVDLRTAFDEPSHNLHPIHMPHLRFASLAVSQLDDILSCFEFPGIQGLNLMFMRKSPHSLQRVPAQLKNLRILRLCTSLGVVISKAELLCLLTELTNLTDFAVALSGRHGFDATYLFTLLTPGRCLLVPKLRALRVASSEPIDGAVDTLLVMLRQRFGGLEGVEVARLELFELFFGLRPLVFKPSSRACAPYRSATCNSLEWLKKHERWNICVVEKWQRDFWMEEMDKEFL